MTDSLRPDLVALFFRIVNGERPRPVSTEKLDLENWQPEALRLLELEKVGLMDAHLMSTDRYGVELYFASQPILTDRAHALAEELKLED